MNPRLFATVGAVMVLVCAAARASKPDPSQAPADGIDRIASLPEDITRKIILFTPPKSRINFSLTSVAVYQSVWSHHAQIFVVDFAAAVSTCDDPSDQVKHALATLMNEMKIYTEHLVVRASSLIQAVGRQKLITNPELASRFIVALAALKSTDGKKMSPLRLTIMEYIFLLKIAGCTPKVLGTAIGVHIAGTIKRSLANSGLGVNSSWSSDLTLWFFERFLPSYLPRALEIRFSRRDITTVFCTIIHDVRLKAKLDQSAPLTSNVIYAILTRMKAVFQRIFIASQSLNLEELTQYALGHAPLEVAPDQYSFTNLQECLKALPSTGAIFEGLRQALNPFSVFAHVLGAQSLFKEVSFFGLMRQIELFGINAKEIYWLATLDFSKTAYTVKDMYTYILSQIYGIDANSTLSPKDSKYYMTADGGIMDWKTQRQILSKLLHDKKYSQAAAIFQFLSDKELVPANMIGQNKPINEDMLASNWSSSKQMPPLQ